MYATQWTGARASGANCLFQGHDPGPGRGPWPEELWLQVDATLTHSRVWAVPLLLSAGTHCLAMPSEPWPGLQGCLGQLWPHLLPLEPHHHLKFRASLKFSYDTARSQNAVLSPRPSACLPRQQAFGGCVTGARVRQI